MRGYTQAQVAEAFRHLGITRNDFAGIQGCRSLREADGRLQALRERVKKQWRKLAFELHPDRTQGDEDKERLFKLLAGVVDKLEDVKLLPARPRPVRRRVVRQQPITWTIYSTSTSGTSTSTSSWGVGQIWVNGRRVA